MPDITADGKTRVAAVPAISNLNAVTISELNAGLLLHSIITADGFTGFKPDTAQVDSSALDSTFTTNVNGRTSFDKPMLRFKKQSGSDTIYDTLIRDYAFFVVVRRSITAGTAWASSQKIQVYPALCQETAWIDPEPNSLERYEVPLTITLSPVLRATVA